MLHQLQLATATIAQAFANSYMASVTPLPPPTWANIKSSKLLINSIPTGASDSCGVYSPEECHLALVATNPSYATLPVTQKPSWVHSPSSYKADSSSSLIVAFEDPDGERLKSMLAARHLFAFGTRATVKKWKQRTKSSKPPTNYDPAQSESDDEVEILTRTRTPTLQAPPAVAPPLMPEESWNQIISEQSPPSLLMLMPMRPPTRSTRQTKARK
jgi:hypothetical protein